MTDGDVVLRVERNEKYKTISAVPFEDDTDLSWKAAGILAYLLTRPDGWKFNRADLLNRAPDGPRSLDSGLQALEELGYLNRERTRAADGTFSGWRWTVSEAPMDSEGVELEDPTLGTPSDSDSDGGADADTADGYDIPDGAVPGGRCKSDIWSYEVGTHEGQPVDIGRNTHSLFVRRRNAPRDWQYAPDSTVRECAGDEALMEVLRDKLDTAVHMVDARNGATFRGVWGYAGTGTADQFIPIPTT